jgi:hypothetical protein
MANDLEQALNELGEQPVYVISCPLGSLADDTKSKAEAILGKVAWLEYGMGVSPFVQMFQPKPDAKTMIDDFGKMVAGLTAKR